MIRPNFLTAVMLVSALLVGCASDVKLNETPVEKRNPVPTEGTDASGMGISQSEIGSVDLTSQAGDAAAAANRTIYFELDSYIIKPEYRAIVEVQARRLTADRNAKLVIEGHTDDRGGSEYNLALGQRRAESVMKALILLGVQDPQLEAVSFGKERPAAQGSDETAWARNRRAELKER